jgi:hypothetical protein
MFKKIKQFICKVFNIKACQCDDEPVVLEETVVKKIEAVAHCSDHNRFRKNCPSCLSAVGVV